MAINRFAGFLLNWLDAKTRGALPRDFGQQLQLTADATAYYDSETLDFVSWGTGVGMGPGFTVVGSVPASYAFVPFAVAMSWVVGSAGATFSGRPLIGRPTLATAVGLDRAIITPGGAAVGFSDAYVWRPEQRVVLQPGTTFGWEVSATAGTTVASLQAFGVRIPITS